MDKKTNYNSIDVIKVCMSVLVVATHTGLFSLIHNKELADTLINSLAIKVPFFFVASGFLVWYKIGNSSIDVKKAKLRRWINKTFRLYIVWTIVYLPFTIYGFYYDGVPVLKSLVVFIRNVLLIGQNFLSWPLWYLLGMLVAGVITYLIVVVWKRKMTVLYVVATLFAISGVLLDYCNEHMYMQTITEPYYKLFQTTRNGFFEGLPYITIGMAIASGHVIRSKAVLSVLFLGSFALHMFGIKLATFAAVYALFSVVLSFDLPNRNDSFYANCRLTSTIIYFVHMIWVGLLTLLLPIKLSPLWLFVIVVLLSFLTAIFVIRNKENRLFRFCFR